MRLKPKAFRKTITTAGTRERLTTADRSIPAVVIQALTANTGIVYVGDSEVSATNGLELSAGDSITLENDDLGNADAKISLKDIWLDVSISTDGVVAFYLERTG